MITTSKNLTKRALCLAVLTSLSLSYAAQAASDAVPAPLTETVTQAQSRPLDRIVAVVNNDVITEYELQSRTHQAAMNLRRQNVTLPSMEELRAQVLDRLITDKAIQQRARELGLRIDEQMVTASIEQIAHNNKLTVEQLQDRLKSEGVTLSAFRAQIRDEILLQRLREREVDAKIDIPESEVDAYLAEQAGFSSTDTMEYHVRHILLPLTADDTQAQQALAQQIEKQARDGADFGQLAAAHSKSSDALDGGDLGWRDSTRLPSVFWQAMSGKVKPGLILSTRSPSAIHIIKVEGERDGVKAKLAGAPVEQTHVRHILMFVSDLMPESQIITRLNDIKRRLAQGDSDFATYARLNSVDTSATRGGDLGWMQAGDLVPEFEQAMNALKPGEISDPVRSQYGYHLIQVLERRTQAPDAARSRLAARQALREKKLADAVQTWQRELHDRAYVEIRRENL